MQLTPLLGLNVRVAKPAIVLKFCRPWPVLIPFCTGLAGGILFCSGPPKTFSGSIRSPHLQTYHQYSWSALQCSYILSTVTASPEAWFLASTQHHLLSIVRQAFRQRFVARPRLGPSALQRRLNRPAPGLEVRDFLNLSISGGGPGRHVEAWLTPFETLSAA
jgi:hypothetical protein